jgi:guanylate kinase
VPEDLAIGLGILLVIGGPSGVGKGTIVRRLLERDPNLWLSVSSTTRPRRDGEVDGRDYVFMSRPEFERLRDEGGFLESFDVYGDLKGTPWRPVEDHLTAGDDVVLEIDVKGAMAIREAFPDAVLVFVRAPSREVQRKRLEGRGQDDPEAVERRLAEAEAEEALADRFDAVVVNDDVGRAVEEVAAILARSRDAGEPPK